MIPNLNDNASRIREEDLIRPALLTLAKAERSNHGPLSTAQLKVALKAALGDLMSDEDRAPLKNRSDTKIDQVIRNLVSHRTLTRKQWVHQENGLFSITEAGKAEVFDGFLDMLPMPNLTVVRKLRAKAVESAPVPSEGEAADLEQAAATTPAAPRRRRAP